MQENPWQVKNSSNDHLKEASETNEIQIESQSKEQLEYATSKLKLKFEDNFSELKCHKPLPDSENYLRLLERKLAKVKKGTKLIESLSEKRQDCMRALLTDNELHGEKSSRSQEGSIEIELNTPIQSSELQRHLLPIQAITVGEIVHIVKHDYLEQQGSEEKEDSPG